MKVKFKKKYKKYKKGEIENIEDKDELDFLIKTKTVEELWDMQIENTKETKNDLLKKIKKLEQENDKLLKEIEVLKTSLKDIKKREKNEKL